MNKEQAIKKLCKKFNIERDIFDFEAEWDSSLTPEENYSLLAGKLSAIYNTDVNKEEIDKTKKLEEKNNELELRKYFEKLHRKKLRILK